MNITDLEKTAEQIVQNIIDHESTINMIAGMVGILPEVALAEKALPAIVGVLRFLGQESGKAPFDVFVDFMNHMTPGKPNSAALS